MPAFKCYGYGRFSPRPDADECESLDTQKRDLQEWVSRKGGEWCGWFFDRAISGDAEDEESRKGLWEALGSLKRGSILVVWHPSRIARSVFFAEVVRREVERVGARIEYLHCQTDDTDEGRLLRTVLAAFAEYERQINAKRTSAMMRSMQANGRSVGGNPPYGYKAVKDQSAKGTTKRGGTIKKLVPIPEEQAIIQKIYDRYMEGTSCWQIHRDLAAEGTKINLKTVQRVIKRKRFD